MAADTVCQIQERALGVWVNFELSDGTARPSESRAQLADLLVESLDGEELGRIEHLWLDTAKRRRDEVRSGTVNTMPGEEALRKVRDSLAPSL